jgi:hypothetical protein
MPACGSSTRGGAFGLGFARKGAARSHAIHSSPQVPASTGRGRACSRAAGPRCRRFRPEVIAGTADTLEREMLRVYLDQNHWVALTKARVQRADGTRFADALTLLGEATERGWVSVPLSIEHAMELQHRRDYASRWELATTMVEVSHWHTIRVQKDIAATEIDVALRNIFGRPAFPRKVQVFGVGANHMHGRQLTNRLPPPSDIEIPAELRLGIEQFKHDVLQNGGARRCATGL